MNCDKLKDIIITDYIDGRLDAQTRAEIDAHIDGCMSCRVFKEILLESAVKPFKNAEVITPPDFLWHKIKNSVSGSRVVVESLNIGEIFSFLKPQWINVSFIGLMVSLMLVIGNYFARDIWSSIAQKHSQASIEVSNNLELGIFGDTPGEETENASNIVGG